MEGPYIYNIKSGINRPDVLLWPTRCNRTSRTLSKNSEYNGPEWKHEERVKEEYL